jgi:sigma-E factor negative regulatory protein RseA
MTEQQLEKISALVDSHLDPAEIGREISRLIKHNDEAQKWYRYQLIGDAMRQELGPVTDPRFAERVTQQLQNEPIVLAPSRKAAQPATGWTKPAAGVAIAASLAAIAFILSPSLLDQQTGEHINETAIAKQPPQANIYVAEDGTRWDLLQKPQLESRLNNYLINHHAHAPAGNMKGIMPYASFVSYDGEK